MPQNLDGKNKLESLFYIENYPPGPVETEDIILALWYQCFYIYRSLLLYQSFRKVRWSTPVSYSAKGFFVAQRGPALWKGKILFHNLIFV
jgi:hypothetical protein